ncbi:MAG: sterol desaturase family protein [Elusimicrobia bacterium]|nr:sterol desaturase family protein [Elusimicrobiota bacterium]
MTETAEITLSFASACVFAEFIGYWLHILLHSEKIEFLSRNHMIHHLVIYAPNKPQRQSNEYLQSTYGRASVLGLGLEWILPVGIMLAVILTVFRVLEIPAVDQAVFTATALAWGGLMFWYMHDAMHLKEFWMRRSPSWSRWFLEARRRHDIHHMDLADDGRMTRNFGICFFFFDRLFGTLADGHVRFNPRGLEAAMRRYAYILPATPGR